VTNQKDPTPVEGRPHFYANHTGILGGVFDVTLDFGFQAGGAEPEPRTRVTMSWEHAVAVLKLLQQQVEIFEEKIGQLPDIEKASVEHVEQGNG
jgi:hypothetical protein